MGTTRQESEQVKATMDKALPKSEVYPLGHSPAGWQDQALCIGQDPEKENPWLSNRSNSSAPKRLQRICAKCPVKVPCLNEGLNECRVSAKTNDTVGTRAGTSAFVRNRIYMMWRAGDLDGIRAELIDARWKPDRADEFIAQMPPSQRKTCPHCGVVKPTVTGFYRNRKSPDGRATWCKDCAKGSVRNGRSGESE